MYIWYAPPCLTALILGSSASSTSLLRPLFSSFSSLLSWGMSLCWPSVILRKKHVNECVCVCVCVCASIMIMGPGWLISSQTQYGQRQNGPLIPPAEPKWLLWCNLTQSEWLCSPVYECVCVCVCVCVWLEREIEDKDGWRQQRMNLGVFTHEYRATLKSKSRSECVNTFCSFYDVKFCIKRRKKKPIKLSLF